MKRYPAFDPPEYADWQPDATVMAEFEATLNRDPARRERIDHLDDRAFLRLYEGMVRFRLHDIGLKRWVRQGVISKAWLGTGEEAVTVGSIHALREGDVVGPMIRNAGACHEMGMELSDMFRAYLGTSDQITRGRDLHTGDPARGILPPISFVASLVPVLAGVALAAKMRGEQRVALTWVGDGASRTGEFHEGFNFAAVRSLPLIVILQDNGVALGTRRSVHTLAPLADLALAYGVTGGVCEGNNVLDVWAATRQAVEICRRGKGPVLLTSRTFRMGGHATHDEAEGRSLFPPERFEYWGRRDPIGTYETWLMRCAGPLSPEAAGAGESGRAEVHRRLLETIERRVAEEVESAAAEALDSRDRSMPDPASLLVDVLAEPGAGPEEPAFAPMPLGPAVKT